ncbi:hypothetical protein OOK60_14425 [Trichothermofontia sichuanensis B231]|uniref:hypothetical protein n=1 Tax=Trichothermofontia sichuanensis TaxID=3045816 RepID=UPI002247BF7E|nr:hypothetical protein [Trichothermofontia sichuanensis]UZQ53681.1 hypothetical protein OOK60_14425 [Trichothermofontia sichuanensis B231]
MMSSEHIRWLVPIAPYVAPEILQVHQLAYDLRYEVEARREFQRYCQWYYETASRNQQEFLKMQQDINILGWFYRCR